MKILNFIVELITSPFTLLIRSNVSNSSSVKWCKPLIIVLIATAIVALLILFFYRSYIFK